MKTLSLAVVTLGLAVFTTGCRHHMEAQKEAFAERVAQKCVAAAPPPQVIVVPAGARVVEVPPPPQ
jgi:hypothetical protein